MAVVQGGITGGGLFRNLPGPVAFGLTARMLGDPPTSVFDFLRLQEQGLRAVGYVRVSTDEQADEGSGLGYQRAAIERFAQERGYRLLEIVEDAGTSGSTPPEERPGFGRILKELAPEDGERQFDVLLVWKFDRLARSIVGAVGTADTVKRRGVALRSVTEPIDTTGTTGELIFSVMPGLAAMERENIARRTWEGRRKAAERGKLPSGPASCYGYKRGGGKLVIVPEEAEVVRCIYALREQGLGARRMAKLLNEEGVSTRSGSRGTS